MKKGSNMRGRSQIGFVIAVTIAAVIGVVAPGGAADKVGQVTEFTAGLTPVFLAGNEYGADPRSITAGPDGNLWFTESLANRIGRITPDGVITEFSAGLTDTVTSPGSVYPASPSDITAGPDGNLWFTEQSGPRIGRITPAGVITEFSAGIPRVSYLNPVPITAGPDGNLWFIQGAPDPTEGPTGGGLVVRITPTGVVTVVSPRPGVAPGSITAGPDGNLWFTENRAIVRVTPDGETKEFSAGKSGAFPGEITAGCDGNLWYTAGIIDFDTGEADPLIGRITPKGKVTEFTTGITGNPTSITAGPDGNLWFTIYGDATGSIGRITPKGKVTEFTTGITGDYLDSITAGPDGNIWFTESDAQRNGIIGRIVPGPAKKARVRNDVTLPTTCPNSRG